MEMPENKDSQERIKQLEEEIRILKLKSIKRRQLEEQLYQAQKMEALASLSGGLAHDFNNILHCILGYTEMALMGKPKESPDYDTFCQIELMINKGSKLARQFLAFGRKIPLQFKPIDLNLVIRELMSLLRRTIPRMIDIELKLDQDLKMISADAGQCEQVLMNLSINSVNAMGKNGKLTFMTENVVLDPDHPQTLLNPSSSEYILLTVSDTGHGMPQETLNRIYEPFFTTKEKGTGLGLSIVYSIVKDHGGFIESDSNVGKGTAFRIYCPVLDSAVEPKKNVELKKTDKSLCGNERILIVDDEEEMRDISSQIFKLEGHEVDTAADGDDAIYKVKHNKYDLLLVDLVLPGRLNGLDIIRKIRAILPNVYIIAYSGFSGIDITEKVIRAGADNFITKPFRRQELVDMVNQFTKNKTHDQAIIR